MIHPALRNAHAACRARPDLHHLMAEHVDLSDVDITPADVGGLDVLFATDMERDPIQRAHRSGAFFEPLELEMMDSYLPKGGTFVDIGANVGNHTLFAGLFRDAKRIIPFEPNPPAIRLLVLNIMMNGLEDRVVFDHVGYGAADLDLDGFGMTPRDKNLGAARMVPGQGDISTKRPDDVLRDEVPDFIKIDVEGMEMLVLRGLSKTIARTRPVLLVEVDRDNIHDFADWRLAHGFELPASIKHYAENRNFLCIPTERMEEMAALSGKALARGRGARRVASPGAGG